MHGSLKHERKTTAGNGGVKVLKLNKGGKFATWTKSKSGNMDSVCAENAGDVVEVLFVEDSSAPDDSSVTHTLVNHSKRSRSKAYRDKNSDKHEDKVRRMPKRRREKSESPENAKLFEQVECYKCNFCLFLSLSQDAVTSHIHREHASSIDNYFHMQCPGCSNTFYSRKSMRVHLSEDHNVAKQELESILSSFKTSSDLRAPQSKQETVSKTGQQQQQQAVSEDECQELCTFVKQGSQKVKKTPTRTHDLKSSGVIKENTLVILNNDSYGEQNLEQTSKPLLISEETGKIRVRKMSSLEKSEKDVDDTLVVETVSSKVEVSPSVSKFSTDECCSSPTEIHIIDDQPNTGHDDNIPMHIRYDIDSMQILEIPFDQQPNITSEQLIQRLDDQNPENDQTSQSMSMEREARYVSASPTTCAEIMDEICQEEVLDNVLYVSSQMTDDRDSPIMVCFTASPNCESGNEEDCDDQVYENNSENVNNNSSNKSSERIIISSCAVDGSDLVGPDGKRLVKRGFVKKPAVKKLRQKKPKILKSRLHNSDHLEQSTISGYKCSVYGCSVRLLSRDNMEYHQRCHGPEHVSENTLKVPCGESENISGSRMGRVINNKRILTCPECSVEILSWRQTKIHLWKYHSIDMELYTCDHCDYKTPSLSNLRNVHEKIHGSEKPYLCDLCGKGFKTVKQLRNHKGIHVKRDTGAESCEVCGRTFHTNRMLRNHINTVHNKVRPYMCSECGHTAANRSSLKMHLRQHTGDRPYSCDQCDYRTADHNSLRRHKLRHTGDKPYKCPHCPYACIQSSTYKNHLRAKHPGEDTGFMFSCDKCPFRSVNNDIYLAHVAEHELAEASGIPFKPVTRPKKRRAKHRSMKLHDSPMEDIPIYVSIATGDTMEECDQPNFENIVQHVSEAIVPGSNLHVLYNSISLSDPSLKDSMMQIVGDDSNLELVGEVSNASEILEMPGEELEYKLQDTKV